MGTLGAAGARVLLAGCGSYNPDSGLENVPAVTASVHDLRQALLERCGIEEANLHTVVDPQEPGELGRAVAEEIGQHAGVLWFHYVGHGLVSPSGQLHLATGRTRTEPGWLAHTALPYASVRDSLLLSSASALVVTLDCCFSGRAVGFLGPGPEGLEADLAQIDGGFVLAAAAREELALAPKGAVHTAFTGELIRLLRQGDPQAGQQLTLLGAAHSLRRSLGEQGFPLPRQRASGRAGGLVLCTNPAYRPPANSDPVGQAQDDGGTEPVALCPYPGLAPFGPEQAPWFFGRAKLLKRLTTQLAQRMEVPEPLVVIGPSGAGKSSLIGAGLVPALERGELDLPGSATWPHIRFTPTSQPVPALCAELARLTVSEDAQTAADIMQARPEHVCDFVGKILQSRADGQSTARARLVIIVDQFEEVFTLCEDHRQRQAFVRALSMAAQGTDEEDRALVVLGVRADFYPECLAWPELEQALGQAVVVGPLTQAGLAEAITAPAHLGRLKLQPGLVDVMLRDLGLKAEDHQDEEAEDDGSRGTADAGALPLLAHALQAVWERRENGTLTLAGYHGAGGIHGAIAATADTCYNALGTEALQDLAKTLLLRLIQVTDKTETRRRMRPADLLVDLHLPDAALVLDSLTQARLITRDTDAVEIAHEILIRAWPRLRTWVEDDRAGLLIRQRLAAAARLWQEAGRKDSELRQQTVLLREEVAWAAGTPTHLRPTAVEQDFLNASMALDRRHTLRRRALGIGGSLLLVLALVAGLLAWQRSQALTTNQQQAAARNIAARADTLRRFDPQTAMLLNVAAWKTAHVPETRSGLLTATAQQDQDTFSLPDLPDAQVHLSGDSQVVTTVEESGKVHIWDVATKRLTSSFVVPVPHGDGVVHGSALNFNGRVMAVQSGEGVRLWDTARGRQVAQMVGDENSEPLALDASGRLLAMNTADHVEVWDTITHDLLLSTPTPATTAEFARGGRLALCNWPGEESQGVPLELWNVRKRQSISRHLTSSTVCDEGSFHFSPDGKLLAAAVFTSGVSAGQFTLWNARTGRSRLLSSTFNILGPGFPFSVSVAFTPDGTGLALSDEREITLIPLSNRGADEATYTLSNEDASFAAFAPHSRTLRFLRRSNAGPAVRSIAMSSGAGRPFSTHAGASVISANGQVVAVQTPDGKRNTVRIVAPSTGQTYGQAMATRRSAGSTPRTSDASPMALSADGRILVLGDPEAPTATVWNTKDRRRTGRLVFSSPLKTGPPFQPGGGLLLSADGTVAAAALNDGSTVQALRVSTGAVIHTIRNVSGKLLAVSADGRRMVSDAGEVIDVASGRIRKIILARYATATQAAFSPDGSLLAATDYAGGLALWNSTATKRLTYLDGGNAYSFGNGMRPDGGLLAFSPDGHLLAAQQPLAPKVTLFDTVTLQALGTPLPLPATLIVTSMAFDPDERDLRVVGSDGQTDWEQSKSRPGVFLVQTPLAPDVLITALCKRVGRDLSRAEWALYVPHVPYRHVCT